MVQCWRQPFNNRAVSCKKRHWPRISNAQMLRWRGTVANGAISGKSEGPGCNWYHPLMPDGKMISPPIPTTASVAIASAAAWHSRIGLGNMKYTNEVDDTSIRQASLELFGSSVIFLQGEWGSDTLMQIRWLLNDMSFGCCNEMMLQIPARNSPTPTPRVGWFNLVVIIQPAFEDINNCFHSWCEMETSAGGGEPIAWHSARAAGATGAMLTSPIKTYQWLSPVV